LERVGGEEGGANEGPLKSSKTGSQKGEIAGSFIFIQKDTSGGSRRQKLFCKIIRKSWDLKGGLRRYEKKQNTFSLSVSGEDAGTTL